ncbi:hypothetical protein R3P38DRAFT_3024863, partial [Favolaschia claudopus]
MLMPLLQVSLVYIWIAQSNLIDCYPCTWRFQTVAGGCAEVETDYWHVFLRPRTPYGTRRRHCHTMLLSIQYDTEQDENNFKRQ